MKIKSTLVILIILACFNQSIAQTKTILDSKVINGFCNNYFDLKENGFVLVFNKKKDADAGTGKNAELMNNLYYYSKDMSKRVNFKVTSSADFTVYGSKNNMFLVDRNSTGYYVRVFDYTGKEVSSRKFNLSDIGVSQDQVSKLHFSANGKMLFEVYDGHQELHLFSIALLNPTGVLSEIDISLPGTNPLESMKFKTEWFMVGESMGYYILGRKGANADYDPNAIAYHIAFYDEDFTLFKELLLDNFLLPGEQMLGKEAALSLNSTLQSFVVSCLVNRNQKTFLLMANYGMDPSSSVMRLFWHKEVELINNEKYKFIENDGISVPLPPAITNHGPLINVSYFKSRLNISEEGINQLVTFDAQGKNTFNAVQMGTMDMLNLDGYCVDNDNLYSRIKKLQMAATLKSYCDQDMADALDIDVDPQGNELAIIRDGAKNQVIIYQFRAKQ
ncbi:MAG: hypothetical protein H7296_00515 [Bacteroidia bacterium]|nr:hypothetical protein [Bacteroidia bacterium]